jgi:hypothetical protein
MSLLILLFLSLLILLVLYSSYSYSYPLISKLFVVLQTCVLNTHTGQRYITKPQNIYLWYLEKTPRNVPVWQKIRQVFYSLYISTEELQVALWTQSLFTRSYNTTIWTMKSNVVFHCLKYSWAQTGTPVFRIQQTHSMVIEYKWQSCT